MEGEIWKRRRKEISADKPGRTQEQRFPRGERDGPLHHWRRGLVGAVQDWADGSKADAATLVFMLIEELDLEEELRPKLNLLTIRDTETAVYVAERLRDAIRVNSPCSTEAQRKEYLTGLTYGAPTRKQERDKSGMIRRVAEFFGTPQKPLRRGNRSKKQGGRPFAFERAIIQRTEFDAAAVRMLGTHRGARTRDSQ